MVAGHQVMKFSFYITFAHVDRTRLRKATTAQTQTLVAIGPGQICVSNKTADKFLTKIPTGTSERLRRQRGF